MPDSRDPIGIEGDSRDQQRIVELEQIVTRLEEDIATLDSELSTERVRLAQVTARRDQFQQESADLAGQLARAQEDLQDQIDQLRRERDEAREALEAEQAQGTLLNEELDQVSRGKAEAEAERDQVQAQAAQLSDERLALRDERDAARQDLALLQETVTGQETALVEAQNLIDELTQQVIDERDRTQAEQQRANEERLRAEEIRMEFANDAEQADRRAGLIFQLLQLIPEGMSNSRIVADAQAVADAARAETDARIDELTTVAQFYGNNPTFVFRLIDGDAQVVDRGEIARSALSP